MIAAVIVAVAGGGLLQSIWRTVFAQKLSKAEEAELLTRLSAAIREEMREDNKELRIRLDGIADAIMGLTDMLDELFPKISGLTVEEREALRHRINAAKKAT